jgi:hypothetical protein
MKKTSVRKPLPGRNERGQWTKGTNGCPPEKRKIVPGHQWRLTVAWGLGLVGGWAAGGDWLRVALPGNTMTFCSVN